MYKHQPSPTLCGVDTFNIRIGLNSIRLDSHKRNLYIVASVIEVITIVLLYTYVRTGIKSIDYFVLATYILLLLLMNYMTILVIGTHLLTSIVQSNALIRAGVTNRKGETPRLYSISSNGDISEYSYHGKGIPLSLYIDKKEAIEAALNIKIIDIRQGYSISRVLIRAVPGDRQVPERIDWDDIYLPDYEAEVVLGVSAEGMRTINLNNTPHVQIGGTTGSGKTILLKCALHQLFKHNATIYLFDYKGLIDFSFVERMSYKCITSLEDTARVLKDIVAEMEHRKALLSAHGCPNIVEYNSTHPKEPLKRIIIASDEIAYAFQKRGQTAETKALVDSIESSMSILAQQGRFAGISLWLSTQRGDADTIPPQIRSNLTVRLCGRASDILSRVTIGSSIACEIPKSIPGRFVDDDEESFQSFYYSED